MPSFRLIVGLSLTFAVFAHSVAAGQSVQGSPPPSQTGQTNPQPPSPKQPKPPEFKNLRFEEDWSSAHAKPWDLAIKAIPIIPGQPVTLTFGGQARWRAEMFRSFNMTGQD